MNFLKRIGIATQLYVAFALILSVTLIVSVLSVTRVNSIDGALQKANVVRDSELEPLYQRRVTRFSASYSKCVDTPRASVFTTKLPLSSY